MYKIEILEIPSLETAIASMFMSKGNEDIIFNNINEGLPLVTEERLVALEKWGLQQKHYKLIESINWSYIVKGLSRGSYDDIRTHGTFSTFVAKSTRYCDEFNIAPWYILELTRTELNEEMNKINRYKNDNRPLDVKRGKQSLLIDTPFTIKTNLHHFLYMLSKRGENSSAHEELKILMTEFVQALKHLDVSVGCKWVYDMICKYGDYNV